MKVALADPELREHLLPLLVKTAKGSTEVMISNADAVMDSVLRKYDTFARRALSMPEILKATDPTREFEQVNDALQLLATKINDAHAHLNRSGDPDKRDAFIGEVQLARKVAQKKFERIRKHVLVDRLPPAASDILNLLERLESVFEEVMGYTNERNLR